MIYLEKFKAYTLTFDFKVKIIIAMSVMLAITIIIYSFYIICIKNDDLIVEENKMISIEDIIEINEYEAEYTLKVVSNKNENEYEIHEIANLQEEKYEYGLDGSIRIKVEKDISTLFNDNISKNFEFKGQNKYNNFVSLASIIKYLRDNPQSKIIKNECDNDIKYIIDVTDLFPDITSVDILVDSSCKINEIKMYNKDSNVIYHLIYKVFKVKK